MNIDTLAVVGTTSIIYHIRWCMAYVLLSAMLVHKISSYGIGTYTTSVQHPGLYRLTVSNGPAVDIGHNRCYPASQV